MTGAQKVLVFRLVIAFAAALAFVAIFWATRDIYVSNAAWAVVALMALENKVRRGEPADERDRAILARASLVGYGVFWVCFILACVSISMLGSPEGTIPTAVVGFFPLAGFWLLEVARASAGLALYARGS